METFLVIPVRFGTCLAATGTETRGVIIPGPTGSTAQWRLDSAWLVPEIAVTANGTNYSVLAVKNGVTALVTGRSYAATNSVALTPENLVIDASAGSALEITENTECLGVTVTAAASGVLTQPCVYLRFKKVR